MSELINKHCVPCEGGVQPLTKQAIEKFLQQIPGWAVDVTGVKHIYREYPFKNYYQVMAFVNAIAWMAHQENHHPDLEVGYNRCVVRYSTHAIGVYPKTILFVQPKSAVYLRLTRLSLSLKIDILSPSRKESMAS